MLTGESGVGARSMHGSVTMDTATSGSGMGHKCVCVCVCVCMREEGETSLTGSSEERGVYIRRGHAHSYTLNICRRRE